MNTLDTHLAAAARLAGQGSFSGVAGESTLTRGLAEAAWQRFTTERFTAAARRWLSEGAHALRAPAWRDELSLESLLVRESTYWVEKAIASAARTHLETLGFGGFTHAAHERVRLALAALTSSTRAWLETKLAPDAITHAERRLATLLEDAGPALAIRMCPDAVSILAQMDPRAFARITTLAPWRRVAALEATNPLEWETPEFMQASRLVNACERMLLIDDGTGNPCSERALEATLARWPWPRATPPLAGIADWLVTSNTIPGPRSPIPWAGLAAQQSARTENHAPRAQREHARKLDTPEGAQVWEKLEQVTARHTAQGRGHLAQMAIAIGGAGTQRKAFIGHLRSETSIAWMVAIKTSTRTGTDEYQGLRLAIGPSGAHDNETKHWREADLGPKHSAAHPWEDQKQGAPCA